MLEQFAQRRDQLNDKWRVTVQFKAKVVGGIPAVGSELTDAKRNLLEVWLKQRLGDKLTEDELAAQVEQTFEEAFQDGMEESSTTFKCDENGVYLEGRCAKAHLKEAGGRLGFHKPVKGTRPSLRQDLHEGLHVDEDRIYLMRDGEHVTKPDGFEDKPIRVMTPQGPRSAIKRTAYVERATCTFTIRILNMLVVKEQQLVDILAFGQDLGLGADRS